jgi:hypothetical protein
MMTAIWIVGIWLFLAIVVAPLLGLWLHGGLRDSDLDDRQDC